MLSLSSPQKVSSACFIILVDGLNNSGSIKMKALRVCITLKRRKNVYQRHRLDVLELDVGDAFEAPRLVAEDQPDVANLSDRREKLLDVLRAAPLRQLHHEHRPGVSLLGGEDNLGRAGALRGRRGTPAP